ncbi:PQQ-dependent sugar dehydrogenase [Rhizorhapis sp. SPR117]|uniref:PQQ-dependent sugar dehydrogenase n=1 Tax=Rhizorhapis sp. SPR117 TaxID=2912611 RepID=UPI001F1933C7|nr:sorbosone dehydrogenase family protein [Rhizorhapis sp. SPR117]
MIKHLSLFALLCLVIAGGALFYLSRGDTAQLTVKQLSGREPMITAPRKEFIPTMNIAKAVGWRDGEKPVAAAGLEVVRFAGGLAHPRSMIRLPNGDILVAETNSPSREVGGVTGFVMERLMSSAGAVAPSANRISLLRDTDGDGKADARHILLKGLNSPYGMALVGNTLYVANTDALMAFPYKEGETQITAKGRKILNLPRQAPNFHWTRNLVASADGSRLYVAVGSASNIGEYGLDKEENRAAILEVDPKTGDYRIFASGLRNPVGMAWEPHSGELWAVVNERDMLGSDLVPDFLTRVEFGAFYGWPWNYWGGYEDKRVEPGRPDLREYTHRPDYGLGSHTAPLGLSFANDDAKLSKAFSSGAFIALHGSWNRKPLAGYKVVFVKFDDNGTPQGLPVDLLTGFLNNENEARGRPVDVLVAKDGALLVSDDVGGVIWRVSNSAAKP